MVTQYAMCRIVHVWFPFDSGIKVNRSRAVCLLTAVGH